MPSADFVSSRDARAIIVMGVSGSGKSTLGARLAAALGGSFLEGDSFHDAAAVEKMRGGTPLTDTDRWPWLDRIGHAARAVTEADGVAVIACSALRRTYRDRLRAAIGGEPRFILLDPSRAELMRRLLARPGHYMPASLLESQLATLERPLADEATLHLAATSSDQTCADALAWLGDKPGDGSGQEPLAPLEQMPAHR